MFERLFYIFTLYLARDSI